MTSGYTEFSLLGRNAAIARAAAFTGVDPINIDSLLNLINAVREADRSIYPDHYTGTGQRSDRVMQPYQDFNETKEFPIATTSSMALRELIIDHDKENIPPPRLTGANLEPLPSRSPTKRKTHEDFLHSCPLAKKMKAETRTLIDLDMDDPTILTNPMIDLTGEDPPKVKFSLRPRPQELAPPKGPRSKRLHHVPRTMWQHNQQKKHAEPWTPIRQKTSEEFLKVLLRLRQNEFNLKKNREVLRRRWDEDPDLQGQTVTHYLKDLSEYLEMAEYAMEEAVALVETHFTGKR